MQTRILRVYLAPGVRVKVGDRIGIVIRTVKHRNPFYKQRVAVMLDGDTKETQEWLEDVTLA